MVFKFSWYVECIIIVHCAIDVVNCKMINDGDVSIMTLCCYNHFITGGLSRLVNAERTNCRSVLHRFCDVWSTIVIFISSLYLTPTLDFNVCKCRLNVK